MMPIVMIVGAYLIHDFTDRLGPIDPSVQEVVCITGSAEMNIVQQ
ncbi:hypothetical protein [Bradyrhizobium sp. USDA 4537]|nr:hypothetical protein [Bradyrhizobium sp. USDA 4537]